MTVSILCEVRLRPFVPLPLLDHVAEVERVTERVDVAPHAHTREGQHRRTQPTRRDMASREL